MMMMLVFEGGGKGGRGGFAFLWNFSSLLARTEMKRPFGRMLRDTMMMMHAASLVRTYDDTVRVVGAAAKYT